MKIREVRSGSVEIQDDNGFISTVYLTVEKRWKCTRCNRFTCEHAHFVQRENPVLPQSTFSEDLQRLIDEA